MTAVLCECAFIDNDTDNDIIDTTAEQRAFGVAYAKAILEYLGIDYNNSNNKSIDEIAKEVMQGKWGNNPERKNRLVAAGYDYDVIQKRVNELCKK